MPHVPSHHQHHHILHDEGVFAHFEDSHSGNSNSPPSHSQLGRNHHEDFHPRNILDAHILYSTDPNEVIATSSLAQERKRKHTETNTPTDQITKRRKYEVVRSFFRVYFRENPDSMVLKEAIYKLYVMKIPKEEDRLARNALYRVMWTHFNKDQLSSFQNNYRDYVKGLQLITSPSMIPQEELAKDIALLQSYGLTDLFGFTDDALQAEKDGPDIAHKDDTIHGEDEVDEGITNEWLISVLEQLEDSAKFILQELKEIKGELKKEISTSSKKKQKLKKWGATLDADLQLRL